MGKIRPGARIMTGTRSKSAKKEAAKPKAGKTPRKTALGEYSRKRDFARTPEPAVKPATNRAARAPAAPAPAAPAPEAGLVFAVQRHDARRLHWDLRLELDGVLKSWAVTRGPSLTAGEKRLAVRTEDHPMDYLKFEGNIPKGEYGGGSVIVWDLGRWFPEGDPHKGFAKGHLDFRLDGARLKGRWHLVRMNPRRGEKTEPWLLIKSQDEFARPHGAPEIIDEELTSALTGVTSEEMAATSAGLPAAPAVRVASTRRGRVLLPDPSKIAGARKGALPAFIEPSLASPCGKPPSGPKWIHEIKHDGYRIQARIDGAKGALLTRKGLDWTARFPNIGPVLTRLGLKSALIDGEVVVEDEAGVTSLNNLQAELKSGRKDRFRYFAFDLMHCNGYDLTKAPLSERKSLLQAIVAGLAPDSPVRFSEHLTVDGPAMLAHACRMGLEGIVSKRTDAGYRTGRNDAWLKAKCQKSQEFVILGYVRSTAASGAVGSLVLGYYDAAKLVYVGRVGTGWSLSMASSLYAELNKIKAAKPALRDPLPAGAEKGVVWAEPRLVCAVEFRAWTDDGIILQASFKGLREDKPATEIVLEEASGSGALGSAGVPPASFAPSSGTGGKAPRSERNVRGPRMRAVPAAAVTLTHPERILWPEAGLTKQGLADYYAGIADWILPHIAGRVLSLLRCPSGVDEPCFFAKHPFAGLIPAVRQVDVGEEELMLALDGVDGLLSLVQAGVVEVHPWGSRSDDLDHPDRLIFDLDPGEGAPWDAVITAAGEVRDRLLARGLTSFVKTTGGKGLHVVVPVEPKAGWAAAKAFTASVAEAMAADHPDRYVATVAKRARRGRIYIDYLRNDRGSTAVAAYSTRSLPQASVSTPLAWDELAGGLRSDHFTVGNLRNRLAFLGRDPWHGFFDVKQRIPGS
jgi:bifunctional non-homologous end joining protein LigD